MHGLSRLAAGCVMAMCVGGAVVDQSWSYPRPSSIVTRWQFEFEAHDFSLYTDPTEGKSFWYFTYTVTNKSGEDRRWAPQFDLFADDGQILSSGYGVPDRVTDDILELLGNPLLETQTGILGELLQGETNAKDGLVIWSAENLGVTEVTMFISGLSGESVRVKNPDTKEDTVLRKTLRRDYVVPGEPEAREGKPIELVQEEWIMR
jgi:hypothetical protein